MKFKKYDEYKSKVKNFIDKNNVETEINVNWKIVTIISLTVGSMLFFGIMFVDNLINYNKVMSEQQRILEEISVVDEDIASLKEQQEQSQSLEFVEKQAREKLKMVKENETVYIDLSE